MVVPQSKVRGYSGHLAVLGLLIASLSAGCQPSPVPPPVAERVTPTPAPIGTVVTPVSAVLSITPAPPPTGVVLVMITTATPGSGEPSAAASATPLPAQTPVAAAAAATSAPMVAQQAPQQIASSGRVTSVQLSSLHPVQLPCPDPRVVIGVPPVPASDEAMLNCQALDATEVPPPGPVVGGMVFRVFTDRASEVVLPSAASLGIAYGDTMTESNREADLVIGQLKGTSWVPVPGQQVDQPLDYASATIVELGAYALYLRS
jgi:hypothetical protein